MPGVIGSLGWRIIPVFSMTGCGAAFELRVFFAMAGPPCLEFRKTRPSTAVYCLIRPVSPQEESGLVQSSIHGA